ncbi:MAG: Obg family GTPase CgtA, partial [Thermocrispum sp.]
QGLRELGFSLGALVEQHRAARPPVQATRTVLRPRAVDEAGFSVAKDPVEPDAFVVHGERPERWVRQTDFGNDEAIGFLADRLARLGVEEALAKAGAITGSAVTIGGVTFDWEPSTPAGIAAQLSGRGTDVRLERTERVGAAARKEARRIRRDGEPDTPGSPGPAVDPAGTGSAAGPVGENDGGPADGDPAERTQP